MQPNPERTAGRPRFGILAARTRPNRRAETVAQWALQQAATRDDADFELIDLADHPLPLLDEGPPASFGRYQRAHTRRWAELIGSFDGFVIVTPEYNHSAPPVLTNAMSYLFAEWNDKSVCFISYGANGRVRTVEHLRNIAGELMMADVRAQVSLSFFTEWQDRRVFTPSDRSRSMLTTMLDQEIAWSNALAPLRESRSEQAAAS